MSEEETYPGFAAHAYRIAYQAGKQAGKAEAFEEAARKIRSDWTGYECVKFLLDLAEEAKEARSE